MVSIWLVIAGIVLHAASGVPGLLRGRDPDAGQRVAAAMGLAGSALGIAGALLAVLAPRCLAAAPPGGFALDGLSVLFLLPIFLIPALGGVYGLEYWRQADHPDTGRKLRLFYGLVTAGLALVTIAANALLFLVAWEIMALSAFFLITTEDEEQPVREVGWIYLVATHLATLALFALFAVMRDAAGSFAFAAFAATPVPPRLADIVFVLAAVSFGLKAGLMPLHIWLPGAHAMAPSHVSALMSGVLIKIGIYGLLRIVSLLPPPVWWGATLLVAGVISGILGVVFAIGQHDLKRLLAYHSVENIGIIVIGLGLGLIGRACDRADLVLLGFAGGLLHVWNHGLFKSLLFFSAGSVIHATHTRDLDRLGGLAKTMPRTVLCFGLGAVAICGLPPLNGFVSELLIYLGCFRAIGGGGPGILAGVAFAAPALALIGGLAVACFVKVFGAVFLGEPRRGADGGPAACSAARESGPCMTRPMFAIAGLCLVIGLAPLLVAPLLDHAVAVCAPGCGTGAPAVAALAPLRWISVCGIALAALVAGTGLALRGLVRRRGAAAGVTWDCGYAAPAPTMQYTASSFAQMLVQLFAWVLHPRVHAPAGQPVFPRGAHFRSHVPDYVLDLVLRPAFRYGAKASTSFRFLQQGSVHAYLFYIVAFLILLLIWK